MIRAKFRPHEKIAHPLDFRRAFERRRSASDGSMVVYGVENGRDHPRLGISIGRKKVRSAVEFCWIAGGWDGDADGVMEGCQHNTMDVEYHGPNPQMQGWYLAALRAGAEMAEHEGDAEFAERCNELFAFGRAWM